MAWPIVAMAAMTAANALGNYMNGRDNASKLSEAYDRVSGLANQAVAENQADIEAYKNQVNSLYGKAPAQYNSQLQKFMYSDVYAPGQFDQSVAGTINDYYDPYANQRAQQAMDAIANTGAAAGNFLSSDYLGRVGAKQQALASEEWEKAYNKLMESRNQALNQFQVNENIRKQGFDAQNERNTALLNLFGNEKAAYDNGMGTALSAGITNRLGGLNTQAQTIMGGANANQNTSGWNLLSGLTQGAGSFLGSYFGGK